jgi:hypothetical protein
MQIIRLSFVKIVLLQLIPSVLWHLEKHNQLDNII